MKNNDNYRYDTFKSIIGYILLLIGIIILCLIIKYNFSSYIDKIDKSVYNYFYYNIQDTKLTVIMKIVTSLGSAYILIPFAVICLLLLKNKIFGMLECMNLTFTYLSNNILKHIFNRPRPVSEFVSYASSSFPSSHTMCSVAVYGLLAVILNAKTNNKYIRILNVILSSFIVLIVGFSRIYLQAHYLTDVIFGIIYGLIFLGIFVTVLKNTKEEI